MRFGILGSTMAWRADGGEVPLGGPARRALLALLLLRPGEVVTRDRLVDVLYGDRTRGDAVHALHSQVSRLRRDGVAIELTELGYRLLAAPDDIDAHRFLRLADAGRDSFADGGDPVRAAGLLREALALWRGPAVADLDSEHGAFLEERRLAALEDRIEADLRRGAHREVVAELGELIERHPLRERLRGQLMRALQADGRPAEALVVFEDTRRLLADELGTDPSSELADLHGRLLRGEGGPPVLPPSVRRTLPARLTSFVGRDGDVAAVSALLGSARLVTLLGPGGAGKTRLAIEVARSIAETPEGDDRKPAAHTTGGTPSGGNREPVEVVLVELASIGGGSPTDGAARGGVVGGGGDASFRAVHAGVTAVGVDLAQVVLGALGVRESGLLAGHAIGPGDRSAPTDRLVAALAGRPMLLVLDNCEHVVHDAAELAERLLSACPDLRVLATSREPLAITAEHLWPVHPLTPDDAVRLFTDRATAARPGFTPDESVERICAALDGLPLAIELAAARMRTHGAHELAVRLADQDRFSLLSRGSRTADPRHQTLRAVVAWSWELLTDREKAMAGRLTVFSGGATARAAAEVCGLADAEDLLDSLADKSLLQATQAGQAGQAGEGRYRMLETIRAFCAEQLADEAHTVRRAHAAYFLDLAERSDPHLRGADQLHHLDLLAAEHDNLQAALRWAADSGEVALGMRLLAAQSSYLWMRGIRAAATGPAVALLEAAGPAPDPELGEAYVLCLLSALAGSTGRDAWESHKRWAGTMVTGGSGARRYPLVTFLWPMVTAGSIDPTVALTVLRRAARDGDPWEQAIARFVWAYPQMAAGEFASAEADLTVALDQFRQLGDRWGMALALDGLSWLAGNCGDDATAVARTEEAIALAVQLGAEEDLPDLLCNRGDHRIGTDPAGARADYERAAELAERAGLPTYLASALRGLGDVAVAEGDLARARELYERALRQSDPGWVKSAGNLARLHVGLGRVAEAEGDRKAARASYERAVAGAVESGALPESARAFEALAALAFGDDGAELAATLLGAAVAMRGIELPQEPEVAERVRAALGEGAYARARRAGARLSHREALALAGVPEEVVDRSPLNAITAVTGAQDALSQRPQWPVSDR
ncbi:BTAD domain-containing putative transcriptional regulator [Nonomuraea sp. NPDC005650]|uniref:BTAD domain-containing putative transcriptional regulator n=1 Tax=Nonomuraea sp. NPDC005650 TaxID=3157045 RepID=UPI0033A9D0D4